MYDFELIHKYFCLDYIIYYITNNLYSVTKDLTNLTQTN